MSGCEEVREILVASARGETVTPAARAFLGEHLEQCPQCRRLLANQRILSAGLSAMAAAPAGVPSVVVKAALMREFRRSRKVTPMGRPVVKWAAAAMLAAALLLMALLIPKWRHTEQAIAPVIAPVKVQPEVARHPVVPIPDPAPVVKPLPQRVVQAKARPVRRPKPAAAAPIAPVEAPAEVATDFLQIPYTEPLRPEERADVFRIQVPRASMAVFGLPVTGGRLDSRITADVLAGEDGVVRAVRFIR